MSISRSYFTEFLAQCAATRSWKCGKTLNIWHVARTQAEIKIQLHQFYTDQLAAEKHKQCCGCVHTVWMSRERQPLTSSKYRHWLHKNEHIHCAWSLRDAVVRSTICRCLNSSSMQFLLSRSNCGALRFMNEISIVFLPTELLNLLAQAVAER